MRCVLTSGVENSPWENGKGMRLVVDERRPKLTPSSLPRTAARFLIPATQGATTKHRPDGYVPREPFMHPFANWRSLRESRCHQAAGLLKSRD